MTQQNAALSEESAASATALSDQIARLNELAAAFRTRDGVSAMRAAEPVRSRPMATKHVPVGRAGQKAGAGKLAAGGGWKAF